MGVSFYNNKREDVSSWLLSLSCLWDDGVLGGKILPGTVCCPPKPVFGGIWQQLCSEAVTQRVEVWGLDGIS